MFRVASLLLLASGLMAQTAVAIPTFGALSCGMVRRATATIQTYCYRFPPSPGWVLVWNALGVIPDAGGMMPVVFAQCSSFDKTISQCATADGITWAFVWDGTSILAWTYTTDGRILKSGTFGALPSAVCLSTECSVFDVPLEMSGVSTLSVWRFSD